MNRLKENLWAILIGLILWQCSSSKSTSVLYSDRYDERNDHTTITIFPYGVVHVPGKWIKTYENNISFQHFFKGLDSVTFAVALNPWDHYEFYNDQITPENFVQEFYEWDANYMKEKNNGKVRIVKEDKDKDYIVWNIASANMNGYFLFGLKGKVAYNLYIVSDEWDEKQQVEFLEGIYAE